MIKAILFNTEMVRAILEGRKTVTRRVVKPQFPVYRSGEEDSFAEIEPWGTHSFLGGHKNHPSAGTVLNPPYEAGDILYVREAFAKIHDATGFPTSSSVSDAVHYVYRADFTAEDAVPIKWRPSIHMPKEAARIFLRVTDVRVERLQHISGEGAIAEGCNAAVPILEFKRIWDNTIKPDDIDLYGWSANPWVWVISFERCERPGVVE